MKTYVTRMIVKQCNDTFGDLMKIVMELDNIRNYGVKNYFDIKDYLRCGNVKCYASIKLFTLHTNEIKGLKEKIKLLIEGILKEGENNNKDIGSVKWNALFNAHLQAKYLLSLIHRHQKYFQYKNDIVIFENE